MVKASLARSGSSSTSVRLNAVDDVIALLCANSVAYVVIVVANIGFITAGGIVLFRNWRDDKACLRRGAAHEVARWWALTLIAKKALTTPAHTAIATRATLQ